MDCITIAGIVGIIGILLGFYLPIILENIKHKNLHIKIGNFFEYDSTTRKVTLKEIIYFNFHIR